MGSRYIYMKSAQAKTDRHGGHGVDVPARPRESDLGRTRGPASPISDAESGKGLAAPARAGSSSAHHEETPQNHALLVVSQHPFAHEKGEPVLRAASVFVRVSWAKKPGQWEASGRPASIWLDGSNTWVSTASGRSPQRRLRPIKVHKQMGTYFTRLTVSFLFRDERRGGSFDGATTFGFFFAGGLVLSFWLLPSTRACHCVLGVVHVHCTACASARAHPLHSLPWSLIASTIERLIQVNLWMSNVQGM